MNTALMVLNARLREIDGLKVTPEIIKIQQGVAMSIVYGEIDGWSAVKDRYELATSDGALPGVPAPVREALFRMFSAMVDKIIADGVVFIHVGKLEE